jgi:hypothetical protein
VQRPVIDANHIARLHVSAGGVALPESILQRFFAGPLLHQVVYL